MFRWFEKWLMRRRMHKAVRRGDCKEALQACKSIGGDPVQDVWIPIGGYYEKKDNPSAARDYYTQAQYAEGLVTVGYACAGDAYRSEHCDREYAWLKNREDAVESLGEALRIVRERLIAAGDSCYCGGEVAMGDKAYEAARMNIPPEKLRALIKHNVDKATSAWNSIHASERGKTSLMYMHAAETFARRLGEKEWSLGVAKEYLCQGEIGKAVALLKDTGGEIPAVEFRETAVFYLKRGELQIALDARGAIGEAFSHEEVTIAAAGLPSSGIADYRKKADILKAYAKGMEKQ